MARSRNSGGLLVLVADPGDLARAERRIDRLVDAAVSVDAWLAERLTEVTSGSKPPTWETIVAADAAGEAGPAWCRLRAVIDEALGVLTQRLVDTDGTVLLTDLGLLARYDRMDLVARWRDALHTGGHRLQALWLLVPAATAFEVRMLDGRAVPVISRNEWSEIPVDWLRNAHRAGANA